MNTPPIWSLRTIDVSELDILYVSHIEVDFPSQERPNLLAMHRHVREGLQEILILNNGLESCAYACAAEINGIILITLLAVFVEMRGAGIGTILMEQLKARYADRRGVLLEVEDPNHAKDDKDVSTRLRRIAFYKRCGYVLLRGVSHISFGVPLNLMALPLKDTPQNIRASVVEDIQAIYRKIMPKWLWNRVITHEES